MISVRAYELLACLLDMNADRRITA